MSPRPWLRSCLTLIGSLALFLVLSGSSAWAAARFSVASGNWSSTAVWSATSGGAPGATAPVAGDDATIEGGFTVTLDAAKSATNVTVKSNSTLDAATFALTVSNTFTLQANSTFKQGGTITTAPGVTRAFDPASTFIFNGSQTSITTFFNFGNLVWAAGNATPGGSLTINGNLTVLTNTFRASTGTGTPTRTHTVAGNVIVDGATTALIGTNATAAGTGTWNIGGNVTTQNGGTLRGTNTSSVADGVFNIGGNLVNNGAVDHGPGTGQFTINFNGTSPQAISGTTAPTMQNVTISNSSASGVATSVPMTWTGTATVNAGSVLALGSVVTSASAPTINGTLRMNAGGGVTTSPTYALGSKLIYDTGAVTAPGPEWTNGPGLGAGVPNHVQVLSGTITPASARLVPGDLTCSTGGIALSLGGNTLTVNGTLDLGADRIVTSGGKVASNITVTRTSGYVDGTLQRAIVGPGSVAFDVGTGATYSPVAVNFASIGGSGNLAATANAPISSPVAASGLSASKYVNRSWTLTNNGITSPVYDATFNFAPTDLQGGANTANLVVAKNTSGTWSNPTVGTRTSTSTQATGLTAFSDFYLGEAGCPTITLAPAAGALPGGTTGVAYSQTITASGGASPYTFAVTTGSLPAGLTLSGAGALSGTSNAVGNASFTVTATDANGCTGSAAYTLAVTCPTIALTPAAGPLPGGTTSVAYSQAISASGGTGPYTFAVTSGALPGGLSLTAGTIAGSPTTPGTFNFSVTATDANLCTGVSAYSIDVTALPVHNVNSGLYFATLTAAINDAGTVDGNTLEVAAGTYEEQVVVNKALTIDGAGCGLTIIKSPVSLAASFDFGSGPRKPVVFVDGVNATVQNLTIDGAGRGNLNAAFIGLGFWNGGGKGANLCIQNVENTPFDGAQHGVGVYTYNNTGGPYALELDHVVVTDFQKNGMALSGNGMAVNVHDCTTTGKGYTAVTAQNGIQVGFGATGTVTACKVTDIGFTGTSAVASGILVTEAAGSTTVSNLKGSNTLSNDQAPITWYDSNGTIDGIDVTGGANYGAIYAANLNNTASATRAMAGGPRTHLAPPASAMDAQLGAAMQAARAKFPNHTMATSYALSVLNSCLNGSDAAGTVGIGSDSYGDGMAVTATNNTVKDWDYGLAVYFAPATLTANLNAISSNVTAGFDASANPTQDATRNWWGNAAGPSGGDACNGATFTPWIHSGDNLAASCGFTPPSFTIVAAAGSNGAISPSGTTTEYTGDDQAYTITPNAGFAIADVVVDGASQGPLTAYTFTNITASHTIAASFAPIVNNTVTPASASACVTPAHPCQTVPVNITRGDATGMRLFHVTFQLSANLQLCSTPGASITEGAYLSAANPNTTFLITPNGGGSYTVDGTINGAPCGATAASGNLFNISVAGTGTSGTGTVTITTLTLRDCSNNTLASTIGGPASVTIDTAPVTVAAVATPQNVTELSPLTITPSATLTSCATGPVTWSVAPPLPAGATFNTGTGEIQWTPACGTAGTYGPFTLTATAASGDAGASNAFSIVVAPKTYTIAASAGAGGTISPSGSVSVNCGANQAFTIAPDACHTIADVLVDGVSVGAVTSYTFSSVTGSHTIAASFNLISYTIAASAGTGGAISPSGNVTVGCGANQSFTISPDACHTIADVLVDGVSVGAVGSYTFTNVTGNHTIAASFNLVTYTIAASAGAGGAISPDGNVSVNCGASQAFTITPDACHSIADVLVDGVSVGAVGSYTFPNVSGNHTIAASFALNTYTIAASAGAGGGISPSGNVSVNCGANQSFTITPDGCHTIADVLVDGVSVGAVASYTFNNVTGNHTIAASFNLVTYTIAASAGAGGAISPSGNVSVNCGSDQAFTITPDACHTIADVLVDGVSVGAVASYTFTNVTASHTIVASFALNTYTIAASAGAGGGISPSGNVSVNCGANQAFTITPDGCHTIADVLVDGVSVGAVTSYTFNNVTGNHTIAASFNVVTYTITASAGTGGGISPSGNVPVNCGSDQAFAITPDACHVVQDVLVDGVSVGAVAGYTFSNVTGNHTIAASFVHVPAVVNPPATVSASQVLLGNPVGADRTGITVHFANVPGAASYKVYRAPFGHYPEYDDNGGVVPTAPTTWPPAAPWTLTGVTADGGVDTPPTRDFWSYVVYAQNACGDVSVASAMTGGTLDYHLGDVSDNVTPGHGDDLVDVADISLLGAHYGINLAPNDPFDYLDVGPTTTNYVDGRPVTDNRVDFEDLVMFAINYGQVTTAARTKAPAASDATPATLDQLTIESPQHVQPGDDDVVVTLGASGTGRVQAASAKLTWDAKVVDLVGWTPGAFLLAQNGALLSAARGTLDLAVLGQGQALTGTGAVATVRFKVVGAGDPAIGIASVDARDVRNAKVTMGTARIVAQSAPAVTTLEPVAPNPSRGPATVSFSIARRTPVDIRIYAVDGRLVRTLFHGVKEPGVYSLAWDGRDDRGSAVAGGVFFARMTTDHAAATRTLTRIR